MATLTYDANEQAEGELNAEEQESLEVGEKLAEQEQQMLAGKFRNAEELEQGYIELQKKLGDSDNKSEEPQAEKEEETEESADILEALWAEAQQGEYSQETLNQLSQMDVRDLAQMHLQYRADNQQGENSTLTEQNVKDLKGIVGGDREYDNMLAWAGETLTEKEVEMYDAVMEKGDPLAAFFAVQALQYRFNDAQGVDGQLLTGKASSSKGDAFRSQAEVVRAMSDPRYDDDPAYRQDIYDKLERSNINF